MSCSLQVVGKQTINDCLIKLVLPWAQLIKIYPPLPTSVQPISITKILLIVLTKNERDPALFTGKLLIKFQNILRNTTQVIIRHRVKILFSVISSPTRYDYNLTIMKSPKPATDNRFKKLIKSYLEFLWYCVSQFENGDR
jgi:hypothetical protein